jgi:hypothetical protein
MVNNFDKITKALKDCLFLSQLLPLKILVRTKSHVTPKSSKLYFPLAYQKNAYTFEIIM